MPLGVKIILKWFNCYPKRSLNMIQPRCLTGAEVGTMFDHVSSLAVTLQVKCQTIYISTAAISLREVISVSRPVLCYKESERHMPGTLL